MSIENTLHRIKKYIDSKGISTRLFEQSVGMSNGSFASQLKNNKTIGVDKVENILNVYRDINPTWLLTGEGEMLTTTTSNDISKLEEKHKLFINDEPASTEEWLRAFSWLIFQGYKSKYNTNIEFNSFREISKQFELTSKLCNDIQDVMEAEIGLNMTKVMADNIKEGNKDAVIPDELANAIDKYDQIYNDFLNENEARTRIMKLTYKHLKTLTDIMTRTMNQE